MDVVIHSKDSEASKEGTDVSSQYTNKADGHFYKVISDEKFLYFGRVLTTRSNGNIFIETIGSQGEYTIWTDNASSNHDKYYK